MKEEMAEEKKSGIENNKKKIIALALALILLIGGTYAWLTLTLKGTKTTRLEAGTLALELTGESDAINIEDALPVTDEEGLASTPYSFTLVNTGTVESEYTVYLDKQAIDTTTLSDMPQNRIRYSLTKIVKQINGSRDSLGEDGDTEDTIISTVSRIENTLADISSDEAAAQLDSSADSDSTVLQPNQYIEYELRLWIDEEATNDELHPTVTENDQEVTKTAAYYGKLRIEATQVGIEDDEAYNG